MTDFALLNERIENIAPGGVLSIPAGMYRISSPIRLTGKRNIRIVGKDGAVLCGTISLRRADFTEEAPGVFSITR